MKPFLLLSIRAEPEAAADEYDTFRRFSGLTERQLPLRNLVTDELGAVDLSEWSGIILGGGPFNASDTEKSGTQQRVEAELEQLLDQVIVEDFPFLGACYGIGTLGGHQGGVVGRAHPEPVGPLSVTLTEAGLRDPVFAGMPPDFAAYGGHKESLERLPDGAVLLATSSACPVQAFKVGENAYATQFHPELDLDGLCTRIEVYKHAGYFDPAEADGLKAAARAVSVRHPMTMLGNFVRRFVRD